MRLPAFLKLRQQNARRRMHTSAAPRARLRLLPLESRITPSAPIPVGPEFRVNTTTVGWQWEAATAMDPAGNSVIAWDDAGGHDGDGRGIFAQRFNAAGVPQGGEFQVNSTTAGDQEDPSVAMTASGAFVVVWGPHGYGYPPGTFGPIHAQRYDASGVPQGGELTANTTIYGRFPRVAIDSVGNF